MPNKYNIIYISYYPWSNEGSRYTNLALALSAETDVNRLLFVNPLGSIGNIEYLLKNPNTIFNIGFYRKVLNNPIPVYSIVAPIPFKDTFKYAKMLHNKWNCWSFRKLMSIFRDRKGLLFIQKPSDESLAMISIAKENNFLTIFDWADLFEQFAGSDNMRKRITTLCREIISMVDIVFCVSPSLIDIAISYNKKSYLFPNAVPDESIAPDCHEMRDKDIRLKSPRICYYGLINPVKLDFNLIKEMVKFRPDWRFVFIGPQIDPMKSNETICAQNVQFLAPMDQCQLHTYIQENMDLCFNPYRIEDEPNKASSPMKLYETMGDGLPFVSTNTFDPLDAKELISIGTNAKDMTSKIEYELENDSIERRNQRILYARKNTWAIRAHEMMAIIDNT